jgi:hypothetical protein
LSQLLLSIDELRKAAHAAVSRFFLLEQGEAVLVEDLEKLIPPSPLRSAVSRTRAGRPPRSSAQRMICP